LIRCGIYTRKSTEEGLEQEFNSLDAQRESGEAFIRSQAGEGWALNPERYDDGGFTGGNTDRPALRRLLADIEARTEMPNRAASSPRTAGLGSSSLKPLRLTRLSQSNEINPSRWNDAKTAKTLTNSGTILTK
jgi:hypothetical protein